MGIKYEDAIITARAIVEAIRPFCQRVEIAGSLRRRRPVVKDIEVVCIPRYEERPDENDLFQTPARVNVLYTDWGAGFPTFNLGNREQAIRWIKPGCEKVVGWIVKPDGAYWRGLLPEGIKLDLFLTTKEKWAVIYTIRTGCAEFSEALVTHARHVRNTPVREGRILNYGRPVELEDERDVFDYLGLEWVEPEARSGREAIKPRR